MEKTNKANQTNVQDVPPANQQETNNPQHCDEVENDEPARTARMRTLLEEQMSAAMIRNCPNRKCQIAIFKEGGCNCMRCTECNTVFCFLCRQTLKGRNIHEHFGTDKPCQLQVDLAQSHEQSLQQGIEEGRRQAEEEMPAVELKNDNLKK
jgi:TRIAD3 protein (E3 ubiquitin-protein ligase RNF216)